VAAILALVLGKLWKPLAALLVAAGLLLGAYWMGYRSADQRALVAVLQAALDGAHKDLEAQAEASLRAASFAQAEARTALEAKDRYHAYLKALQRRPNRACGLTDFDLHSLRGVYNDDGTRVERKAAGPGQRHTGSRAKAKAKSWRGRKSRAAARDRTRRG
jgi:hypothetical protein